MSALRVAFLSGAVLELLATLCVRSQRQHIEEIASSATGQPVAVPDPRREKFDLLAQSAN